MIMIMKYGSLLRRKNVNGKQFKRWGKISS